MGPNPNLELVYNGLVNNKLIDTTGGYNYNKFESWIKENPSNLNTVYNSMIDNNIIDNENGGYTFDKFSNWVGDVEVNKQQHLEETKKPESGGLGGVLFDMFTSNYLLGGFKAEKEGVEKQSKIDGTKPVNLQKLSTSAAASVQAHNALVAVVGHGGSMAFATFEGGNEFLNNEDNKGAMLSNIKDMGKAIFYDNEMRKHIKETASQGLEADSSPVSTMLEMFASGTPEEKKAKAKLQLAQTPGLLGLHTTYKYLMHGALIPTVSGLVKDTDMSPFYDNEHAKYIEELTEQYKVQLDTSTFKDKGISAFLDPNFIGSELADGVGFFASAAIQGYGTGLITRGISRGVAAGVGYGISGVTKVVKPVSSLAKFDKAFNIARKVTDKADLATGVTVMSVGEAAMEAQNLEKSLRPLLEEKYNKMVQSGEISAEDAPKLIDEQLNEAQRETFTTNVGLLLFSNGIELGGLMRSFKPKGVGKYLPEDISLKQRAGNILKSSASEAVEENLQAAIGAYEENKRVYDKYDDYGINLTRIFGEGVKGLADPTVQRAMLIGGVLGGGAQSVSEYNDYKKVKKYYNEIQPEQLKDAQVLGLNSVKSIYTIDENGKVVVDEVAKKNFMKSYLDHQNDINFLDRAIESNDTDLINFAHNNLISKFVQRSLEGGADAATTLAGVESVLNAKYDPTKDKSQIKEVDSDGTVISFEEFKAKKLEIAERAVATHQHVEKISKSKNITDIKHKADIFDAYNKHQYLGDKIDQLISEKSKVEDSELQPDKDLTEKLDNRINKLKMIQTLYGARIGDLTRPSSIKARKTQSILENIKMNSKDDNELKTNLQKAVDEGTIEQKDMDSFMTPETTSPFERPKDDQVIDQETAEEDRIEKSKILGIKVTELEDEFGVTIEVNSDNTFEQIIPAADTEEAALNAQRATEELQKLGFTQVERSQPEDEIVPEEEDGSEIPSGRVEDEPTTTEDEERKRYGLESLRPTYRGTSMSEWEAVKNGEPFRSKKGFGENQNNNTWVSDKKEYSEDYLRSNEDGVLVEFKPEAIDKSTVESGQQNDDTGIRLGYNLTLEDVQRVTDKNGNVIYDANEVVEPEVKSEKKPKKTKKPKQQKKPDDEAFTESKKRDLKNEVDELQDVINSEDAPNAAIEYLRSFEAWNKLAYLVRSFRQFFRVGTDSFSVTRKDFDNHVRDEIRDILNPNEYKPGKKLKVVLRDDDSMEMYVPGDVEKETTTWGKIKEQLKSGPIIGFFGEEYIYDDLVPLAILDENDIEQPLNIHITSWMTEFNLVENEEGNILRNIEQLRKLRSSILANPKVNTTGVGIQITDRTNGVLFFIKDQNGQNEETTLSELAPDIDLVTFTGGTFKGTRNTNSINVPDSFNDASLGVTYFLFQLNVTESGEPLYSRAPVFNKKLKDEHKKSIKTAIEIFATGKTHEHYSLFKNAGFDLTTVKGIEKYLSMFVRLTHVPKGFKTFGAYMKTLDSDHFGIHVAANGQIEFGSKLGTKSTFYLKDNPQSVFKTLDQTLDNLFFNINADMLQNSIGGNIKMPIMNENGFEVLDVNYANIVRENVEVSVNPLKVGELDGKPVYVATIQAQLSFSLESDIAQTTTVESIKENIKENPPLDTVDGLDLLSNLDGLDIPGVGYSFDLTNPCK